MDELVKAVAEKTGLSEDMAQTAVNMVLNTLKDKLPEPIASQLKGIIAGDVDASNLLSGGGGFLNNLLGGDK